MEVRIQRLNSDDAPLSTSDVSALNSLFLQLSGHFTGITREEIGEIASKNTFLIARDDGGNIVGTVSLICFRQPMGLVSRVEDIVVDSKHRGQGIGHRLMDELIMHAKRLGANQIDLTTNPAREEANRLYPRVGFEKRKTNVYVLYL